MTRSSALALVVAFVAGPGVARAQAVSSQDMAMGAYLAGECFTCHRRDGQDKGIPSIVGWPVEHFVAALQSYRQKDRANPVMQAIAAQLSEQEMRALAAFFYSLKTK